MMPFTPHRSLRSPASGRARAAWGRFGTALLGVLVAAAMLGGSLEIHTGEGRTEDGTLLHGAGHGLGWSGSGSAWAAGGDGAVVAECHPGAPLHLDAPQVARHPTCPACLLHSSARTARPAPSLGLAVVLSARGVLPALNLSLRRIEGHEGLSRGPPSA